VGGHKIEVLLPRGQQVSVGFIVFIPPLGDSYLPQITFADSSIRCELRPRQRRHQQACQYIFILCLRSGFRQPAPPGWRLEPPNPEPSKLLAAPVIQLQPLEIREIRVIDLKNRSNRGHEVPSY